MLCSVLVVDNEASVRQALTLTLASQGYTVRAASNGNEAMKELAARPYEFVICDIRLPVLGGMELLSQARKLWPRLTFLMMSAYGDAKTPLEMLDAGAYDYIKKPFPPEEAVLALKKAQKRQQQISQKHSALTKPNPNTPWEGWLGKSQPLVQLKKQIERVAASSATVILQGESGTGKELVAKALHACSERRDRPFIAVNCAALPEGLAESELFGHVRGAFTNAYNSKRGLFSAAHEGTLFLDEVAETPLALQAKLLRVLQEGEFRPLGSTQTEHVDIRVVAATNRHLKACVAQGTFREDLYFRLNVIHLHIPPLRERRDDILCMAESFAKKCAENLKKKYNGFSERVEQFLLNYRWPGNIRELEHAMESATQVFKRGKIEWEHLPQSLQDSQPSPSVDENLKKSLSLALMGGNKYSLKEAFSHVERVHILAALRQTKGNQTQAATLLKISKRTLNYKIKDYGMSLKLKSIKDK